MPRVGYTEGTFRSEFEHGFVEQLGDDAVIVQEAVSTPKAKRRQQADYLVFRRDLVSLDEKGVSWENPNALLAVIETKKSGTDISDIKHANQVLRYLTRFKPKAYFLTNYRELRIWSLHASSLHDTESIDYQDMNGVLSAIGRAVRDAVPEIRQPSVERILNTLRDAMNHLVKTTKSISNDRIRETLGLDLLISSVDAPVGDENWESDLAQAAAFLVISQMLFYMVLHRSRERTGTNYKPKLKALSSTSGVPSNI